MIDLINKHLEQCSPIQKQYILAIISGLTLANNIVRESRKEENPTHKKENNNMIITGTHAIYRFEDFNNIFVSRNNTITGYSKLLETRSTLGLYSSEAMRDEAFNKLNNAIALEKPHVDIREESLKE